MIIILCGPSGVGKSYVCNYFTEHLRFTYPVPYTTRHRRTDEIDGKHYHFLPLENLRLLSNDFKRGYWVNLMGGSWYGYSDQLDHLLQGDNNIILHLQTGLSKQIKQKYPYAECFFLNYLTEHTMKERILARTNTEEEYNKRLQFSRNEIKEGECFLHKLSSDNPHDFVVSIKDFLGIELGVDRH